MEVREGLVVPVATVVPTVVLVLGTVVVLFAEYVVTGTAALAERRVAGLGREA
jgi:hypothetical protein